MTMKTINILICSVVLAFASGCGGGGGGGAAPPTTPPPVGGIGRTGIAVGPIATFGSVVVNGVRYETGGATFTINGVSGSQSDLRVHFGLGKAEKVDRLEIRWANGEAEEVQLPQLDRSYTVVQGKGLQDE